MNNSLNDIIIYSSPNPRAFLPRVLRVGDTVSTPLGIGTYNGQAELYRPGLISDGVYADVLIERRRYAVKIEDVEAVS